MLRVFIYAIILKISLFSCAGGFYYSDDYVEFVFLEKRDKPFLNISSKNLNSPYIYNELRYKYEIESKEKNLKEWKKYIFKNLSIKEIETLVYDFKNINSISNEEVKNYIQFVQKQQNQVLPYDYYSPQKKRIKTQTLINQALNSIKNTKSPWLKLRYFYLGFRLAHYKNKNALEIYNKYKYLLKTEDKTIVKDWIQALYSGALIKNEQEVKGVYEFTKLFSLDAINWYLSFYDFDYINTNKKWNALLFLAKNDEEKTKFYAIRALNKNSNKLEELENIYKLDKNSQWFDFLLYKVLIQSQSYFNTHNSDELYETKKTPIKKYISFLQNIKKDDMYLVNLALSYFNLYENNIQKAKEYSKKANKTNKYPHEAKTLSYVIYLNTLKTIDIDTQNTIYSKLEDLISNNHKSKAIENYTFVILKKLFSKNNDKFLAYISSSMEYLDTTKLTLISYNKFINFINNKAKSKLQEYMINNLKKRDLKKELDLVSIKLLINNLKFKEALETNNKYLREEIKYNPFNALIKGNNRKKPDYKYSVKNILEKAIQIKKVLKNRPNSPIDNYLYGNLIYNLSYFGNSNMMTTLYRSNYSIQHKEFEIKRLEKSSIYYKTALKNSKKSEFKAKIIYMLAKNELALYDLKNTKYVKYDYYWEQFVYEFPRFWEYENNDIFKQYVKDGYGKFFTKLKNDYSNTKYYKELIKECYNLRKYEKLK